MIFFFKVYTRVRALINVDYRWAAIEFNDPVEKQKKN